MPLRSFRMVCEHSSVPLVESLLRAEGYDFEPEPFSSCCYKVLHEPRPLGASLAAFFGYIYIQNRSAMLPPLALAPAKGCAVLDMCASPGGKSGFLAQLTGSTGFVLANEPAPARLGTLRANLHNGNLLQVATCSCHGARLPLRGESWDAILLDPPCSGWGTAEKHPSVLKLWRGSKIQPLIALQRQLLRHAAALLAPGGCLVYSTCTTNAAENEDQTSFAEHDLGLELEALPEFPGFVRAEGANGTGTLQVDGEKSQAQGFFLARLRKPGACSQGACSADVPDGRGSGWHGAKAIDGDALTGPCCDPALLPQGLAVPYGGQVRFISPQAHALLPSDFVWQGALLGRYAQGRLCPSPRLRVALPSPPDAERAVVLDEVKDVAALLAGTVLRTSLDGREAGLWWRDLPLGCVMIKNGRVVAAFK